ncbi:MAG: esterase [Actinomycetota bacterium]
MAGGSGDVIALGHFGRPVLAFAPLDGRAWDFDDNGMIGVLGDLLDSGGAKLYCVDGRDSDDEKARTAYENWIIDRVLPFVHTDCGGPIEVVTLGCADGAGTAVDLALRRADLFPIAIGMSGRYDAAAADAVAQLGHDHVDWVNGRLTVVLGVGDEADNAAATSFSGRLGHLGIRCEVDAVPAGTPCGWPGWRHLAATHLPRFC